MDIFTRFNRKSIDDRQIDSLIGISKGLTADRKIEPKEAEFLMTWLVQARQASQNPIVVNLLERVTAMLEDGHLDEDESAELLALLHEISGDPSEVGELARASTLPIDHLQPVVQFPERSFFSREPARLALEGNVRQQSLLSEESMRRALRRS